MVVVGVVVAAGVVVVLVPLGDARDRSVVQVLLTAGLAAILGLRCLTRTGSLPHLVAWRVTGAAAILLATAHGAVAVLIVVAGGGDAAAATRFVGMMVFLGLLTVAFVLRGQVTGRRRRTGRVLDGVLVAAVTFIAALGVRGLLGGTEAMRRGDPIGEVVVPMLVALLLTVSLVVLSRGRGPRAVVLMLGMAASGHVLGTLGQLPVRATLEPAPRLTDIGWTAALVFLLAALSRDDAAPGVHGDDATESDVPLLLLVLVPGALVAGLVVAVVQIGSGRGDPVLQIAVGCLVAVGLARWIVGVLDVRALVARARTQQEQIDWLAYHDPLTALPNRAQFRRLLSERCGDDRRTGTGAALLLADLDDFASVNDILGHPAGDELLTVLADRLRSCAGEGAELARLGGDEFAVLTPDGGGARGLAEGIQAAMARPVLVRGHSIGQRMSIGIACDEKEALSPNELLRRADTALYAAKRTRKGSVVLWDVGLAAPAADDLEMHTDLAEAIATGLLVAAFQPVYSVDGRLDGFEALARWSRNGLAVPPGVFVPAAARMGLLPAIDDLILDQAVRAAAHWRRLGRALSIGVNLSQGRLSDAGLPGAVAALLAGHGLPANLLVVEVPEGDHVESDLASLGHLAELRRLGVRIALDDFGVGYSSLSRLQSMPPDILKIDRQFVSPLVGPQPDLSIVNGIVGLAHQLGAKVVAEGVEAEEQRRHLVRAGVDALQGYLLGRPTTRSAADALVAEEIARNLAAGRG